MPTRIGTIWAQFNNWHWASIFHYITVRPNHRDITSTSALTYFSTTEKPGDPPWLIQGYAGIKHIVSNGTFEEFEPPKPCIQRDDVTEIKFRAGAYKSTVYACHKIDYWN